MRISDWSSDVCSSDLRLYPALGRAQARGAEAALSRQGARGAGALNRGKTPTGSAIGRGRRIIHRKTLARPARLRAVGIDRKSVGEGKSVYVRVDLGVRRNIKNKKKLQ